LRRVLEFTKFLAEEKICVGNKNLCVHPLYVLHKGYKDISAKDLVWEKISYGEIFLEDTTREYRKRRKTHEDR